MPNAIVVTRLANGNMQQVLLEGVEAKRPFTVLFGGIYVVTVTFLPPAQNNNSDVFTPSAAE